MPEFLRGSIVISLVVKIISAFSNAYNNSILKRFFGGVNNCFKNSVFYGVLSSYAHKKPWFRYSLTYKIVMFFVKVFDKIFEFIYKIANKCVFGSMACESVKKAKAMSLTEKCCAVGALLISIPIGAMVAAIVFKNCTVITIVMSWAVFVIGVMVVLVGIYGKESIIVKLIRAFISAVK